jgi:hypothetical protein
MLYGKKEPQTMSELDQARDLQFKIAKRFGIEKENLKHFLAGKDLSIEYEVVKNGVFKRLIIKKDGSTMYEEKA